MDILSFVAIRLRCLSCGEAYSVPLSDVLTSHQILHEGCPVNYETECPPLFQSRLASRSAVENLARAWRRLAVRAQKDGGELVLTAPNDVAPATAFHSEETNSQPTIGEIPMVQIKRAYESPSKQDGARFLVERLWPRGVKKEALRIEAWLKEVAPSTELREWFQHDPAKWTEFRKRYARELENNPQSWQPLLERARRGRVTLIYSAHDTEHNNAVVLKDFLERKMKPTTKAA